MQHSIDLAKAENASVIEVYHGLVYLLLSWNPDSDEAELQCESYSGAWSTWQGDPALTSRETFWEKFTEINGQVCGGIEIDDEATYDGMRETLLSHPRVSYKDIPNLKDGTYTIY